MCHDNVHLMLNFGRDIWLSLEKNQFFQFFVQKKCLAYEAKLFNGANSQLFLNMVKADWVDFNITCIRFHVCKLG